MMMKKLNGFDLFVGLKGKEISYAIAKVMIRPPIAVEVKNKAKLDFRDAKQLGRNLQTMKQGGASGLIYKIPSKKGSDYLHGELKAISEHFGCDIKIIRI